MDQRSSDGWISGWFKIFVICKKNSNVRFWSTRCEECFSTEQDHPYFPHQKENQSGGTKRPRNRTVSFAADRLPTWSTITSGSLEPMILSKTLPTCSLLFFEMTIFRNSILSGKEFYSLWRKSPPDDILEGLSKLKIRESEKLKTVLELCDLEIQQRRGGPDYHRLKTGKNFLEIIGNGKPTGSVLNETIAVSVTISTSVQKWHSRTRLRVLFMQQNVRNASRTRSPRGKSPSGTKFRLPCKDYLKGTCTNSFCTKWHSPVCLFYKTKGGCRFAEKCSYAHRQVVEQPSKSLKKNDVKKAVAMLKKHESYDRTGRLVVCRDTSHERHGPDVCNSSNTRQLRCVFQDMEPPKSSSILRKSSDMRKPIRCVQFTLPRHAYIRDQNPSLGYICPGEPHQRSPNAPKFEDRSQEETEWQERWAREAAWRLA